MKKIFSTLTLLCLLSACGTETITTNQITPPNMAPDVISAQSKAKNGPSRKPLTIRKNEISTDTFSGYVKMKTPMVMNAKPSLQVFFKVKSQTNANKSYDNGDELMFPYEIFFDSESINETGDLRLGKDGIIYLQYTVRSNAMVINDNPPVEYYALGTYQKKASFKDGDAVAFKINDGNALKMRWRMGEVSKEGIDIYIKPNLAPAKSKPELF